MTDLEKKFEGKIQNLRKIEILLKLYERYIFLGLIKDVDLKLSNLGFEFKGYMHALVLLENFILKSFSTLPTSRIINFHI